jgi:hypothetical protein
MSRTLCSIIEGQQSRATTTFSPDTDIGSILISGQFVLGEVGFDGRPTMSYGIKMLSTMGRYHKVEIVESNGMGLKASDSFIASPRGEGRGSAFLV